MTPVPGRKELQECMEDLTIFLMEFERLSNLLNDDSSDIDRSMVEFRLKQLEIYITQLKDRVEVYTFLDTKKDTLLS